MNILMMLNKCIIWWFSFNVNINARMHHPKGRKLLNRHWEMKFVKHKKLMQGRVVEAEGLIGNLGHAMPEGTHVTSNDIWKIFLGDFLDLIYLSFCRLFLFTKQTIYIDCSSWWLGCGWVLGFLAIRMVWLLFQKLKIVLSQNAAPRRILNYWTDLIFVHLWGMWNKD